MGCNQSVTQQQEDNNQKDRMGKHGRNFSNQDLTTTVEILRHSQELQINPEIRADSNDIVDDKTKYRCEQQQMHSGFMGNRIDEVKNKTSNKTKKNAAQQHIKNNADSVASLNTNMNANSRANTNANSQANTKLPLNWSNILLNDSLLREIARCFPFPANVGKLESGEIIIDHNDIPNNNSTSADSGSPDSPSYKITRAFSHSHSDTTISSKEKDSKIQNKNSTSSSGKNILGYHGTNNNRKRSDASISQKNLKTVNFMVLKSLETVVPIVLPLEIWLKERLSNWIQLSGHEGTIIPASEKTLWKKCAPNDNNETEAYFKLMSDQCANFVPKFYKEVEHNGEFFIEIEDLTQRFNNPAIIDVKLGTRTFLESEVTNQKQRNDLYLKMVQLDASEPTAEEHAVQAVTKLRYMQFREKESSTASLGFRIDAIKERNSAYLCTNFKKLKIREQIASVLCQFFGDRKEKLISQVICRLKKLRSMVESSEFFRTHEVIGSSLLILYDDKSFGIWMIDFAKAFPLPSGIRIDHRSTWSLGNHEDGYLFGLDNFIQVLESI